MTAAMSPGWRTSAVLITVWLVAATVNTVAAITGRDLDKLVIAILFCALAAAEAALYCTRRHAYLLERALGAVLSGQVAADDEDAPSEAWTDPFGYENVRGRYENGRGRSYENVRGAQADREDAR